MPSIPSSGGANRPTLSFRGIDIGAESIRELSQDIPLSVAKKTVRNDGYDQVIFQVDDKRYIATGDGLNFKGIKAGDLPAGKDLPWTTRITDTLTFSKHLEIPKPVTLKADFLGQEQEIKILDIDNETNTAAEGAGLSVLAAGGMLALSNIKGALSTRFISGPPLKALSAEALGAQSLIPRLQAKWTILQHDGINWGARQVQKIPGLKNRPVIGYAVVMTAIGVASLAAGAGIGAIGAKMRGQGNDALDDMTHEMTVADSPKVVAGQSAGTSLAELAHSSPSED